jgi:hypothetical protein
MTDFQGDTRSEQARPPTPPAVQADVIKNKKNKKNKKTKIAFAEDDGTVETLWAVELGQDRFRIVNTPFFYYGVSLGDVVEARWRIEDLEEAEDEDEGGYGFPYFERVVEKSGNRTLRLVFAEADEEEFTPVCKVHDPQARAVLRQVAEMGCSYESFPPYLAAINVPATVELDQVMSYLESTGLMWENGDPQSREVPGRTIYSLKVSEEPTGEDQLGGSPALPISRWPVCPACGEPQSFVLLLRRHPQRLALLRSEVVVLYCCFHCSESTVLLLNQAQLGRPSSPPPPNLKQLPRRYLAYTRGHEPNPWAQGVAALGPPDVSKIGGYPRWQDVERTPCCSACGATMSLVAQLGPDIWRDVEMPRIDYLFVCPDEHEGRLVGG